jgi:hypothetical protein
MSCCCQEIEALDDGVLVVSDVQKFSFDGGITVTADPTDPNLVHVSLGGPGAVSLQLAYDGGEVIVTDTQDAVDLIRGASTVDAEPLLTLLDANANPGRLVTAPLISVVDLNVGPGHTLKLVRQGATGGGAGDPGGVPLWVETGQSGPNLAWFAGAPSVGSDSGFFNMLVTDSCGVYTQGSVSADGSPTPGQIALLGWSFMMGGRSDIGVGAKAAVFVSFSEDVGLDHFQFVDASGGDTAFRLRIKQDGTIEFNDGSSVTGQARVTRSATGGLKFESDEPGAANNRPAFDFVATQNIPAGPDRMVARFGENGSAATADIRAILNSDGGLRIRGADPAFTGENLAATPLFALSISGGLYTGLVDNVSGAGMKFITTGNPGAGTLAFQFSDGGGVLLQVDGDGDAVVTKDIEAAGGYQKTIGIWTHALIANQTDVALTLVSTVNNDWTVFRAGSITGIATRLDAAVSAGTLTINVRVNGVIVFTSTVTATTTVTTQAKDVDAIVASDLITVSYTSSAGFTGPVLASVEVEIEE